MGVEMAKKGRPQGLTATKYYEVLLRLRAPIPFTALVKALSGQVSRLTARKILKDALLRGAATVTYRGRTAIYELTSNGRALENTIVFVVWWRLGRPRLDGEMGLDQLQSDIYATFLLDRYPLLKIRIGREECPELFMKYPDYVMAADFRLIDIYRSLGRRIMDYEKAIDAMLRSGHDPMQINKWIKKREIEGLPEDTVLHRVSALFELGTICKRCFERGRISELVRLDDGYECPSCRQKYGKLENFLQSEFEAWLTTFEGTGMPLKKKNILICPPKLKVGILEA
jgi:hypothetical protein